MSSKALKTYCADNNLRLTPPREIAFKIIRKAKKPMSAYDVLEAMGKTLKKPKPPTAYRALEFLQEHGFIHRIESLNAYIACGEGHRHHGSQFMICDSCGNVEEVHLCSLPDALKKKVAGEKFKLSYWNAELHGNCKDCSGKST